MNRGIADEVLQLLIDDHRSMQAKFARLDGELDPEERRALVSAACREIAAHQQLEEEVFYAVMAEKLDDRSEIDEGLVEHGMIRELAERVSSMAPDDVRYEANLTVLGEYLNHHLREEEKDLFPMARKAPVDFGNLLDAMREFRRRLRRERGLAAPAEARPQ